MGWLWSLVTVIGPLLLLAAIVWAVLKNKAAGRRNLEQAERGARELREELERNPENR